jgi:acyl carrier protein
MVFEKVKKIIVEQLQVEESSVALETSLMKDLEADSLDAVEIIMGIETEFGIEIPDDEAEKFQSIGDIVKFVEGHVN